MQDDGYRNLLSHDSFAAGVPHKTFERMRQEDPLAWTEGDSETRGFWSLTRHADILQANKQNDLFSSARGIRLEDQSHDEYLARRTFQETDPPEHSQTRLKVNPRFAIRTIAEYEPMIRTLAADIVEEALASPRFDIVESIAKQLPMMMLGRILGVADEDLDWLVEKGDALIGNSDPDFTSTVVDQMDTSAYRMMPFRSPAGMELYDFAADVMAGKRQIDPKGLLAHLLADEERLDELEFKNFFCLLIAAGNDTTRYSIAMALYLLSQNPALIRQLKSGDCWDTCADEFIRLASPTMHFRRTATRDIEMHGKQIREGDKVLLWFVSGSRDETVFENPHEAKLERKPNRHLAFGQGGAHVCLGMHLARLEIQIALQEFVKRIDTLQALEEPSWTRSNFICGVKRLSVECTRISS